MSTGNMLFNVQVYGYATSNATQLFSAAWALAGLPFIFLGIAAVQWRSGPILQLFLGYLVATFFIDIFFLIMIFFLKDACAHLKEYPDDGFVPPGEEPVTKAGKAFACGVARGTSWALFWMLLLVMAYCIYTVWSHVKELMNGGSAGIIARLMSWEEEEERKWGMFEAKVKARHDGVLCPAEGHER